jgi:hypothetical protein
VMVQQVAGGHILAPRIVTPIPTSRRFLPLASLGRWRSTYLL